MNYEYGDCSVSPFCRFYETCQVSYTVKLLEWETDLDVVD